MSQPCFLDDQNFTVLLDAHLLQEHVHDDECHQGEQERVIFYGIDFKDNEGLIKQRTVHALVQRLVVVATSIEVFHHIPVGGNVYPGYTVFIADVGNALYGELIERVE